MDSAFQTLIEKLLFLMKFGLDLTLEFVNSSFFLTIIGTIAAAFAGTYGAQHIIKKNKEVEDILREIRNTNAAIMIAFHICNKYLSLKKQHVKSMKDEYDQMRTDALEFQKRLKDGLTKQDELFEIHADFKTIAPLLVSIDILQKQIFEQISAKGRALGLTTTLISTIESLNYAIETRNQLIETYKSNEPHSGSELACFYFGFPDSQGNVDHNYPDYIDGIHSQTDDCIFFCKLLCEDLNGHGEKLKAKLGKGSPKINKIDFTLAEDAGLMPNQENYKDWMTMFKKMPDKKQSISASK